MSDKYSMLDKKPGEGIHPAAGKSLRKVITLTLRPSGESRRPITLRFNKDRIVIGSVVSADVRLVGDQVAPIHAVLELLTGSSGELNGVIYDLASDSGVSVNGAKVVTQTLKNGDSLRIGGHELSYSLLDLEAVPQDRDRVRVTEGRRLFLNPDEDLSPLILESERNVQPIFDYRPAQKRALEVVMSWKGTILAVEHFVKEQKVTIGTTRKSDFGVPPILSESRYAIVTRNGEDFVLNLDARMKGVMQRKGKLDNFEAIRSGTKTPAGPLQLPIGNDDFAKVSVGDIDFYMSYTAAPPRLKPARLFPRDPVLFKVVSSSMLLTGLMIFSMLNANVPPALEAEKIPERIATILYQPERYTSQPKIVKPVQPPEKSVEKPVVKTEPVPEKKPEPVKKVEAVQKPKPPKVEQKVVKLDIKPDPAKEKRPVPKEMNVAPKTGGGQKVSQNVSKEGEGARAKGTEGKRGSPQAVPNKTPQDKASRTSPQGGPGKGEGASQVSSLGNVDILNTATAKITNLLGNAGEKLGKNGDKLKGFGGFTTQGTGGLALSGEGKGGGGTSEMLGGLGKQGLGGGRIGTGMGAAGTGTGIVGGAVRVAIKTGGPEEAVVMGTIDAGAVEAALLAHQDEFRLCYEKEINAENNKLAGRLSTTFVIGSSGNVTQAGIESKTLKSPNLERCVLNVIRRIQFPIPRGAGLVQVTYPFKFSPTKM